MKVTYDATTDMAYLDLTEPSPLAGSTKSQVECVGRSHRLILDFDEGQQLIGIEIFDARSTLPRTLLENAEIEGRRIAGDMWPG